MHVGLSEDRLVAYDPESEMWFHIGGRWNDDVLSFLAGGAPARQEAQALLTAADRTRTEAPLGLPFKPGSLRAFALWESHMVGGGHGMIDRFGSPVEKFAVRSFERVTGKTFPALRMPANYFEFPQYYMSNHRTLLADGMVVPWPSFSEVIDFELELGIVVGKEVRDASVAEGRAAIAGFTIINDWSLRDVQWSDTRKGTFGGVVKAKTWAGSIAPVVVTADEIIERWTELTGRVRVNGSVWAEGSTARPSFGLGEVVAYASRGETLYPGDVLSSGTLPGCCGLELRRFPQEGDEVQLEIDGIGTLTNTIGRRNDAAKKGNN